jgi:hypothetical protein
VPVLYKDGWCESEGSDTSGELWHWMKKDATLAVRNPKRTASSI